MRIRKRNQSLFHLSFVSRFLRFNIFSSLFICQVALIYIRYENMRYPTVLFLIFLCSTVRDLNTGVEYNLRLVCRGNLRFVINSTVVEVKWVVTGINSNGDWAYCGTSKLKSFFASSCNVHVTCVNTVRKQRKIINLPLENPVVLNTVKDVLFQ